MTVVDGYKEIEKKFCGFKKETLFGKNLGKKPNCFLFFFFFVFFFLFS